MSSPTGTLIAYATAPGSVAADGFGPQRDLHQAHPAEHPPARPAGRDHVQARSRGRGARDAAACRRRGTRRRSRAISCSTRRARRRPPRRARRAERGPDAADRARVLDQRARLQPARGHPRLPRQVSERQASRRSRATASTPWCAPRAPRPPSP
jgi:hypothetical protein